MLATQEGGRTMVSGYLRDPASVHVSDAVVIDTDHYTATIDSWRLGSLPVSAIADPNRAQVTRSLGFTDPNPGSHLVGVLLHGTGRLTTEARSARLSPGAIVLYDARAPFVLRFDDAYHYIVTEIPDALLAPPSAEFDLGVASEEVGTAHAARVAVDVLASLPAHARGLSPLARARLGETFVALLRDAVDEVRGAQQGSRADELLPAILGWIETRLNDPALSPAMIASAHYVSVRYLHRLFERHGVTVGEHIRRRRVEQIKNALADPRTAALPISAIGARWGFTDATQLIRQFRAVEGVTPGRWRRSPSVPD